MLISANRYNGARRKEHIIQMKRTIHKSILPKAFALALLTALMLTSVFISVGAAETTADGVVVPGGKVNSHEDLIVALGGEENATTANGITRLKKNIILAAPINIQSGSYKIIGGGCSVYRGFEDGAMFQLSANALTNSKGEPIALPTLTLGAERKLEDQNLDDPDLILDGNSQGFKEAVHGPIIGVLGKGTVTINPSTKLTNNRSAVPGGAIYLESFSVGDETTPLDPSLKIIGGEISGNSSEVAGGAIAAYGRLKGSPSGTVSITNCKIEGNSAASPDKAVTGKGGAVFSDGFELKLTECEINSNIADEGGALYLTHNAEIATCSLTKNIANVSGGAIYIELLKNELDQANAPANVTLTNNYMVENRSEGSGGAIVNNGVLTFVADNPSYVSNNTAKGDGAIIVNGGVLEFNSGQLYHNTTSNGRGGIYNTGTINFNGADVRTNTATIGGAIYNLGTLNYYKGCLMGNKCTVKNAPQVANLGKMTMKGSFVIEEDVVGLFPIKSEDGSTEYTSIEVTDKITTNVKINIAFYKAIEENGEITEVRYANKSGYFAYTGLKRYTEIAAPRSQIAHSGFGGYTINENGALEFEFPLMPLGAWIGTVLGAAAVSVGIIFFIKKKKTADSTKTEK